MVCALRCRAVVRLNPSCQKGDKHTTEHIQPTTQQHTTVHETGWSCLSTDMGMNESTEPFPAHVACAHAYQHVGQHAYQHTQHKLNCSRFTRGGAPNRKDYCMHAYTASRAVMAGCMHICSTGRAVLRYALPQQHYENTSSTSAVRKTSSFF